MKTHLLTKKRALISSVAMLLVAIIALGTATFAWFTQNTQATADELQVRTIKASELQVSDAENEWGDTIHYNFDKVLKPASSADGNTWLAAVAASKSSYEAGTVSDISSKLDGYVFKEQLNVRNNGAAAVENVKIKFNLSEIEGGGEGKYARLAIVEADKKGTDATLTGSFKDNVYAATAGDSAEAFTSTAKATTTVTAKSGANAEFNVGNLTAKGQDGAVKYYNIYLWFEGQDTDCKDVNGGNNVPKITFTVIGDTVNQQG